MGKLKNTLIAGVAVSIAGAAIADNVYKLNVVDSAAHGIANVWDYFFPKGDAAARSIDQLYAGEHDGVCASEANVVVGGLASTATRVRASGRDQYGRLVFTVDFKAEQPGQHHILYGYETGIPANQVPQLGESLGTELTGDFLSDCELKL